MTMAPLVHIGQLNAFGFRNGLTKWKYFFSHSELRVLLIIQTNERLSQRGIALSLEKLY
jgi:hypothetical protein